jgi:YVTN family beta-propeller protein
VRRFRWVRGVLVFGLAGALVGLGPARLSSVPARRRCRPTAFVANTGSDSVSTIDVRTRTKDPTDIAVGTYPSGVEVANTHSSDGGACLERRSLDQATPPT